MSLIGMKVVVIQSCAGNNGTNGLFSLEESDLSDPKDFVVITGANVEYMEPLLRCGYVREYYPGGKPKVFEFKKKAPDVQPSVKPKEPPESPPVHTVDGKASPGRISRLLARD